MTSNLDHAAKLRAWAADIEDYLLQTSDCTDRADNTDLIRASEDMCELANELDDPPVRVTRCECDLREHLAPGCLCPTCDDTTPPFGRENTLVFNGVHTPLTWREAVTLTDAGAIINPIFEEPHIWTLKYPFDLEDCHQILKGNLTDKETP